MPFSSLGVEYHQLYQSLILFHVLTGALGLFFFWRLMLRAKGTRGHTRLGGKYNLAMYLSTVSAFALIAMVLHDPVAAKQSIRDFSLEEQARVVAYARDISGILFVLGAILLMFLRHGTLVLRTRADRRLLRTPGHLLVVAAPVLGGAYLSYDAHLQAGKAFGRFGSGAFAFYFLGSVGVLVGLRAYHYIFKQTVRHNEWILEHLMCLIGSSIVGHTSFVVNGVSRLVGPLLSDSFIWIPWALCPLLGLLGMAWAVAHYGHVYRYFERGKAKRPASRGSHPPRPQLVEHRG